MSLQASYSFVICQELLPDSGRRCQSPALGHIYTELDHIFIVMPGMFCLALQSESFNKTKIQPNMLNGADGACLQHRPSLARMKKCMKNRCFSKFIVELTVKCCTASSSQLSPDAPRHRIPSESLLTDSLSDGIAFNPFRSVQ
jgi:hypothetical protein